jgi:hypothetical protein
MNSATSDPIPVLQEDDDAGGGTRTPDTRIMIPRRLPAEFGPLDESPLDRGSEIIQSAWVRSVPVGSVTTLLPARAIGGQVEIGCPRRKSGALGP